MLESDTAKFVPSITLPLTTTSLLPPSPTIPDPSHCLTTFPVIVRRAVPEESRKIPAPSVLFPDWSVTALTPAITIGRTDHSGTPSISKRIGGRLVRRSPRSVCPGGRERQ